MKLTTQHQAIKTKYENQNKRIRENTTKQTPYAELLLNNIIKETTQQKKTNKTPNTMNNIKKPNTMLNTLNKTYSIRQKRANNTRRKQKSKGFQFLLTCSNNIFINKFLYFYSVFYKNTKIQIYKFISGTIYKFISGTTNILYIFYNLYINFTKKLKKRGIFG